MNCRNSSKIYSAKHRIRGKIDTPNILTHDRSFSWYGTGTSIKSSGVKIVLSAKTRRKINCQLWGNIRKNLQIHQLLLFTC